MVNEKIPPAQPQRNLAYRVLRYVPNLVRDEWVNIGVLLFDESTGERRLRLIEDESEYARVRRLHPAAEEPILRRLRDDLEDRFATASTLFQGNGHAHAEGNGRADWLKLLDKFDATLSNSLQLSPQKGLLASDLDAEIERLYADHVAPQRPDVRVGAPVTRGQMRSYCSQVLRQARLWDRMQRAIRAEEFTFPGDPLRLDYAYRRNGTRGFVQTLSVTRAPADVKSLAYTVEKIREKVPESEFTAVTDIHLISENERHRFVQQTLQDAGMEAVALEGFAVWAAKMRPMIQ